jgi:hypothetical protein
MASQKKINANPTVYAVDTTTRKNYNIYDVTDEESFEPFDAEEVFGKFFLSPRNGQSHNIWHN